jgi:hypothetical protein
MIYIIENWILYKIMSRRKAKYKFKNSEEFYMSIEDRNLHTYIKLDKRDYSRGTNKV